MTLKIDTKFEGKLTCASKNDMRNLANFHQSTQKSQNWDFNRVLLSKVENVRAGDLCVMTMKNDSKFEEKLTCLFKTDMRNLTNFDPSTHKSQTFPL